MPITSWHPERVLGPVRAGFRPAALKTGTIAKGAAPGPRTKAATRVTLTGASSALLHAPGVAGIVPIVKGSKAGLRTASRFFAFNYQGRRVVVKAVEHPGTPPHDWLQKSSLAFRPLYSAEVRRRLL